MTTTISLLARSALRARNPLILRRLAHTAKTVEDPTYVPGGPIYKGTVNDPTTFPPPSRTHGSYHWSFERLLAAGLVPLTTAAFVTSPSAYPAIDALLGVSLVMHSHIGFDCMIVDYLHKRKFPILGPVMTWSLRSATVATLIGIYQFNTNDVGLTELIARVWGA